MSGWDSPSNGGDTWGTGIPVDDTVTVAMHDEPESVEEVTEALEAADLSETANAHGSDRACFNCGEPGHNKADCPNPFKFTGTCNVCGEEGHMRKECPSKPVVVCKNCNEEGHIRANCDKARKIDRSNVADVPPEDAWEKLATAIRERDELEVIQEAIQEYVKSFPEMTYVELQKAFYDQNLNLFLIAKERDLMDGVYTNMDLQGNLGKKYTINYFFSEKRRGGWVKDDWPQGRDEILARLEDAGEKVESHVPLCGNCKELGHISKNCPQEKAERERPSILCYNCGEVGHRVRDCPQERVDRFACRSCGELGHKSAECPTRPPRSMECRNCNQEGHMARDCPEPRNMDNMQCRNCDEMGHGSRNCPKPRDMSRVKCENCNEMGHLKFRCEKTPMMEVEAVY